MRSNGHRACESRHRGKAQTRAIAREVDDAYEALRGTRVRGARDDVERDIVELWRIEDVVVVTFLRSFG